MVERAVVVYSRGPDPGSVSLFPSESVGGVQLTVAEIARLASLLYGLDESLTRCLTPLWAERLQVPRKSAELFARGALAPLTHFFWDRALRLDRLLADWPGGEFFVAEAPALESPGSIQRFLAKGASSVQFNQSCLCMLAPLLGCPVKPWAFDQDPFRSEEPEAPFVNYNFALAGVLDRVRKKLHRVASRAVGSVLPGWRGVVPTPNMAYDQGPLEARGFFGKGGFAKLDTSALRLDDPAMDPALRAGIFQGGSSAVSAALRRFIAEAGVRAPGVVERAPEIFSRYLAAMTPSSLLEGVPRRLERVRGMLRPFCGRPLVMAEVGHLESICLAAGARMLGMEVIGCQHGGGPGNLDHMRSVADFEYPLCDLYVTRGWRRMLVPNPSPGLKAVPLPSPWLSERARFWRGSRGEAPLAGDGATHDILLMSDKIIPFPRPGMGLDAVSSDFVREQSAMLKSLVAEAAARRLSIIHKPYNRQTVSLLQETLETLKRLGGDCYLCWDRPDKGLSPALVGRCRLVIWDKPSSGFSECLAARIPTMVLWPRFSSVETPSARGVFMDLEDAGVVHREAGKLCEEYLRFRAAPEDWMGDRKRARAVLRFRRRYAWSSPKWPRLWRRFVDSLAAERPSAAPRGTAG